MNDLTGPNASLYNVARYATKGRKGNFGHCERTLAMMGVGDSGKFAKADSIILVRISRTLVSCLYHNLHDCSVICPAITGLLVIL